MSVAMFRRRVDPRKLAGRGARLEGDLPPESLRRLSGLLIAGSRGDHVHASLEFRTDAHGMALLCGRIDAGLTLQCQRCLEPVQVPVKSEFRFVWLSGSGDEALPEGFEAIEQADEGIVPAELVEEEVLLALPFAAAHESLSDCGELAQRLSEPDLTEQAEHPFEVLKSLKLD